MKKEDTINPTEIQEKLDLLENARITLKKEFIGIDKVIDQVFEAFNPWFLFPTINDKPVIINLWGLTGTGKTSLVKRIMELINLNQSLFRFDMGACSGQFAFQDALENMCNNSDLYQNIIMLDEFQHSRTITKEFLSKKELKNDQNRLVWDLLDSGIIEYSTYNRSLRRVENTFIKLKGLVKRGLKCSNGVVTRKKKIFRNEFNNQEKSKLKFVPEYIYDDILECSLGYGTMTLEVDLDDYFMKSNEAEILDFLSKVVMNAKRPIKKDLSSSLIFVIGNLDEAYTMSANFSTDLSADEFHDFSLKIKTTHIKEALTERFRNEQIARLGNTHIIYPAFSKDSYQRIIKQELEKIKNKFYKSHGIKIKTSKKIETLIYEEGVIPVQGTRPVFTTVNQIVKSKIGKIYSEAYLVNPKINVVLLDYKDGFTSIVFKIGKEEVHQLSVKQELNISELKQTKNNDIQAITAVHESGHAICSVFLSNTLPECLVSVSSDSGKSGFMFSKSKLDFISKKHIVSKIATGLGGYLAEKLIFGEDYVTLGSESDIESQTEFATNVIRKSGMGKHLIRSSIVSMQNEQFFTENDNQNNNDVLLLIQKATIKAEEMLSKQKELLIQMANYLSDHTKMDSQLILSYCRKYGKGFDEKSLYTEGEDYYYRGKLKSCLKTTSGISEKSPIESMEIILNKG